MKENPLTDSIILKKYKYLHLLSLETFFIDFFLLIVIYLFKIYGLKNCI